MAGGPRHPPLAHGDGAPVRPLRPLPLEALAAHRHAPARSAGAAGELSTKPSSASRLQIEDISEQARRLRLARKACVAAASRP